MPRSRYDGYLGLSRQGVRKRYQDPELEDLDELDDLQAQMAVLHSEIELAGKQEMLSLRDLPPEERKQAASAAVWEEHGSRLLALASRHSAERRKLIEEQDL